MNRQRDNQGEPISIAPPRLIETQLFAGDLIGSAIENQRRRDLSPPRNFALGEGRGDRSSWRRRVVVTAFGIAAAASLLLVWKTPREAELTIASESSATFVASDSTQADSVEGATPATTGSIVDDPRQSKSPAPAREDSNRPVLPSPPVTKPPRSNKARSDAPNCSALASTDSRAAIDCFRTASNGTGVTAEFALLELARLQSRALGDRRAALASLELYQRRYPQGSLHREATMARFEHLVALGDRQGALRAALAARESVPEQRGRFTRLAAELSAQLDRCEQAEGLAREAKAIGEDVEEALSLLSSCR